MVVDTGRRVEVESPACKREGENRLTALAQDRLCSGVSRSLAVSATDLGVMGGHHRQQWRSSCINTNTKRKLHVNIVCVQRAALQPLVGRLKAEKNTCWKNIERSHVDIVCV